MRLGGGGGGSWAAGGGGVEAQPELDGEIAFATPPYPGVAGRLGRQVL
jgi:hypothetical protein